MDERVPVTVELAARAGEGECRPAYRSFWLLAALAASAIALLGLWFAAGHPSPHAARVASDTGFVLVPALAAASCWSASRRGGPWARTWRWISFGALTWCLASMVWAFYELVLGQLEPFPSWADVGYIGYAVPMGVGLYALPRERERALSRLRANFDVATIGLCLLFVSWTTVLAPVRQAGGPAGWVKADALAYPTVDVALAALVLGLGARYALAERLAWLLLGGGLLLEAATDSSYVVSELHRTYASGSPFDLTWLAAFALIALAARAPARAGRAGRSPVRVELIEEALPYLCAAAALLVVVLVRPTPEQQPVAFALGCLAAAVVTVRQVVVLADHSELTAQLDGLVRRRTAQLAGTEHRFAQLVANLSDVIIVVDRSCVPHRVSYVSPSIGPALGLPAGLVTTADQVRMLIHRDDAAEGERAAEAVSRGSGPGVWRIRMAHADGRWRHFEVTARALDEQAGGEVAYVLHDVTDRERLTDDLRHQALHDALTGLPNTRALSGRLTEAIARADRRGDRFAVLLVDLDGFKSVNDTFGHPTGDEVLQVAGRRLAGCARSGDLVCRLGGDEFAVVLEPVGDSGRAALEVLQVAERILAAMRWPFTVPALPAEVFQLSASIGIAVRDAGGQSGDDMLRDADLAMYAVKAEGKDNVRIYDEGLRMVTSAHRELEEGLRRALRGGQLFLNYQPIIDLGSRRILGFEALMRWEHPQRGLVPPNEFIPVAESCGLIVPIGRWALATACAQLRYWHDAHPTHPRPTMAVNVSPMQLGSDLGEAVRQALDANGLEPADLVLEITEGVLVDGLPEVLTELADLGVGLSVDDFGTGYSSLSRLSAFPVRQLKIDRSFVSGITNGTRSAALVASIISMAHAMNLTVVAEGIEEREQLAFLRQHGCELGQGFLLGRPMDTTRAGEALAGAHLPALPPIPSGWSGTADELHALLATAAAAGSDEELGVEVRRLLRKLEQVTGFESTYLTRIDWTAGVQEIAYARNTGSIRIEEGMRIDWDQTVCRGMLDGGPRATADLGRDYPDSTAAADLGLCSYAGAPVYDAEGTVFGTLCAVSASGRQLDTRTVRVMELFADLLTDVVKRLPFSGGLRTNHAFSGEPRMDHVSDGKASGAGG